MVMRWSNCPERKEKGKMDEKRRIVIAGAGVMGGSIALLFARHGYEVAVYDIEQKGLDRCQKRIQKEIAGAEIIFTREKECFARAGFVVEAIVENIEAKHLFWREISSIVSERAILTTNTSGLSATQIAEAVKCPRRFCGMHWLNPPHICPLIEVIKGEKTDAETAEAVRQTGLDVGRVPVMLEKEVPGFLINRFQFAILREAMSLVETGAAKKEDIDKVFKYGLGLRYACLGPFEIADLGGLDTFYRIASYLFADLCDEKTVMPMLAELVENGDYGVKTGKGFYEYLGSRAAQVITKRDEDFEKLAECLYRAETRIHQ